MQNKGLFGTGLSLLSGAAIGAVLMYIFDPEEGDTRRTTLGSAAGDALRGTGQTLGMALGSLTEGAKTAGHAISEGAGTLLHRGGEAVSHGASSAASTAGDWLGAAGSAGHSAWHSGKRMVGLEEEKESSLAPVVGISAVSATAIGVAAFYLLDPARGAQRRQQVVQSINSIVGNIGNAFRTTGRSIGIQMGGNQQQHMDYATSEDYVDHSPEVGSIPQSGTPSTFTPQGM